MRSRLVLSMTMSLCMFAGTGLGAQEAVSDLTPRAISDSTYAARIALDALQDQLRRGQLDPRFQDPSLQAATLELAKAAGGRARRPPIADLGVAWDLVIDVLDFEPAGTDELRARGRVSLATLRDTASSPVTFVFRRNADRWDLVANPGLAGRLTVLANQVKKTRP